jgi:hypothetical protein
MQYILRERFPGRGKLGKNIKAFPYRTFHVEILMNEPFTKPSSRR